ncbi:MAG: MBL fold metallo-hydrolase [Clostridiales bacterium]|nr:MBL fold metallo-hydrolase [Candidatus Crickella merdequi]
MSIKVFVTPKGFLKENTYVFIDEATGYKAVVDPGYYGQDIADVIGEPATLKYIMLTHSHGDHIMALPDYRAAYPDAKLVAGIEEKMLLEDSKMNGSSSMKKSVSDSAEIYAEDGQVIELGETSIRCIHTPGHTIGGMCYLADGTLFSGDTLFYASVGATHFPTGDWEMLKASIYTKLFKLPDSTVVLSGHGPETSIGFEKKNNPYV